MATKPNKPAAKTVFEADTGKVRDETAAERMRREHAEQMQAQLDELGITGFRRWMVGHIAGLASAVATGMAVGAMTDIACAGAALLPGGAFLSMLIWIIGVVLSIYAAISVGTTVADYIHSAKIDKHFGIAKSWVGGLIPSFKRA